MNETVNKVAETVNPVKNAKRILEIEKRIAENVNTKKQAVFDRFPLPFTLLATFGLVATFYGFERVIDNIDFFQRNPYILLITGLLTLVITGTLYKKLQ